MSDAMDSISGDIETRADADKRPRSSRYWLAEIANADKIEKPWRDRGKEIVERYRGAGREQTTGKRANILWSNTETLKSALYSGIGNIDVRRRYPKDGDDQRNSRTAATVLERAVEACADRYDMDVSVEAAISDMLLPGRGVLWLEASYEEGEGGQIANQSVEMVHVGWADYRQGQSHNDNGVPWRARCHKMTKDDVKREFPRHADKLEFRSVEVETDDTTKETDFFKRATVWEIWDKVRRERVYVSPGCDEIIKADADPYRLEKFFPCPDPLYATKTTDSGIPVPEFDMYKDQADELDRITTRIYKLLDAMRRRGVYAAADGKDKLKDLAKADDNEFIPWEGWQALLEKGGLQNLFFTEDLRPYAQIIPMLADQRQSLVQTIYEITGISDIIRGATQASETATAQQLKAQFGSLRMQKRQAQVQRFVRDAMRIKAEYIAEHFTREMLVEMTGVMMVPAEEKQRAMQALQAVQAAAQMAAQSGGPPPPTEGLQQLQEIAKAHVWEGVAAILRSDERRAFKLDIETDNTAFEDEAAEKEQRIEFTRTMMELLGQAVPAMQMNPTLAPFVRELVMFNARGMKAGRQLEETLEDAFDQMQQQPPQQGQPDPVAEAQAEKIKADVASTQQKMQADGAKAQADIAGTQQRVQIERAKGMADLQLTGAQLEIARKRLEQMENGAQQ